MKPIRVGLIGCGSIARELHLPVLTAMADVLKLCAVCDANEAGARRTGEQYQVPWYTSVEEMFNAHPDMAAVDICTWMWTHQIVATQAARAGKHILIEKPLALTLPWADEILAACAEAGVHIAIAENYPFWPNDRLIQRIVRQGGIGELIYIYSRTELHPFVIDFNIHRMAQMRAIVNSPAVRVIADMRPQSALPPPGPDHELHEFGDPNSRHWGMAAIDFANGVLGVVEGAPRSFTATGGGSPRRIVGSNGTIYDSFDPSQEFQVLRLRPGDREWAAHQEPIPIERMTVEQHGRPVPARIVAHTEPPIVWENPYLRYHFAGGDAGWACWYVAMADAYMDLYRAVTTGQKPEWDGQQARADLELCIATFEAYLRRTAIELPLHGVTQYEEPILREYRERFDSQM
jgi:predicted dehydrogenase